MNRRSTVAAPSLLVGNVFGVLHTTVELLSLISDLPWHQPEHIYIYHIYVRVRPVLVLCVKTVEGKRRHFAVASASR